MERSRHTHKRLSVSMIVRNEEKFLDDCLRSVHKIADEIVVVDTGSTDATCEIASNYGAKIHAYDWNGDFSAARNYALQKCSGDWILYIDADERLTPESADLLLRLISQPKVDAYTVIIQNPQSMQQGSFRQQNAYPRLFRKLPGVRFEGRVHEQVWHSLTRLKCSVHPSTLTIRHLGYDRGYDVVRQKAERNLDLLRAQLLENPDDAYTQFQIGNSLVVLQRHDEAKPAIEQALANPVLDRSNRALCYNLLAEIAVRSGEPQEAILYCLKSIELAHDQLMARWFLSLLYYDRREYDKALEALGEIVSLLKDSCSTRSHQIASDLDLTVEDVYTRMALTYESADRLEDALELHGRVMKKRADDPRVRKSFLRCVEKVNDSRVAIENLNKAMQDAPHLSDFLLPLALHHRKLGETVVAQHYLGQAVDANPESGNLYALAIRWCMESDDKQGAERFIRFAEERGIRDFEFHKTVLQISLTRGDVGTAFKHLELMAETTDADLTPLRNRISALASKLSTHEGA